MTSTIAERTTERAYRLVRPLARGGSAWVWEAEAVGDDRAVVVKRLDARDPAIERLYRSELAALRALRHPHVVEMIDHGEADGALHIVLERVEGIDLERALGEGPLAPAMALAIVADVATALAHAHTPSPIAPSGIAHRDVRPANVLVDARGRARLSDFGLARGTLGREPTASDFVRGTPGSVAPESVLGASAGTPADLWALGALLHTMVVGRPPIRSFEHAHAVAHGAPILLDAALADPAKALVQRCMVRSPDARPSAAEIAERATVAIGERARDARVALSAWVRSMRARERGTLDDLFLSTSVDREPTLLILQRSE
jgi:serine/threonine-protein kinase